MIQRKYSFIILTLFYLSGLRGYSQPQIEKPNWDQWQYLIGEWIGEGGGDPGEGSGSFTFEFDLQKNILVRKNHSDYPATKDRPAFSHDDLMIIYQDADKHTYATYWDNEGHIINYTVNFSTALQSIILISDIKPSTPRFKLTYSQIVNDSVSILFEIAPPGNPDAFTKYLEGKAHKKK